MRSGGKRYRLAVFRGVGAERRDRCRVPELRPLLAHELDAFVDLEERVPADHLLRTLSPWPMRP